MDILKRASFFEKLALNLTKSAQEADSDYLGVKELDDVSTTDDRKVQNQFVRACEIASTTLGDNNVETQSNGTKELIDRVKAFAVSNAAEIKANWSFYFEQILNRIYFTVKSVARKDVLVSAYNAILDGWDEIEKLGFKATSDKPEQMTVPTAGSSQVAKPVSKPGDSMLGKTLKNFDPTKDLPASPNMSAKVPNEMNVGKPVIPQAPQAPIPGRKI